jgi:hypothetical protein
MKPVKFTESTIEVAKDQPQYLTLPVHKDRDGLITGCWSLSLKERLTLLFTGKLWVQLKTFNQPLQPHKPSVSKPVMD